MLLRYIVLSLLSEEEMHGYRIKSAFETRMGRMWPLNFGQIYAVLRELKKRGLIVGRLELNGNHMGRWVYGATARGRRALGTWLARRPRPPVPGRNEILVRLLSFWHEDGKGSRAQLESQECVYRGYLDELQERRAALAARGVPSDRHESLAALAIDAAIYQVEAHLRWLQHCGKALAQGLPEASSTTEAEPEPVTVQPVRKRERRQPHRAAVLPARSARA